MQCSAHVLSCNVRPTCFARVLVLLGAHCFVLLALRVLSRFVRSRAFCSVGAVVFLALPVLSCFLRMCSGATCPMRHLQYLRAHWLYCKACDFTGRPPHTASRNGKPQRRRLGAPCNSFLVGPDPCCAQGMQLVRWVCAMGDPSNRLTSKHFLF